MRKLVVAPFELHARVLSFIERETQNAKNHLPARIIAKLNSLVDERTIEALYRASQAGVKVELIVRGICCLRPGVPGLSENITVRSVVDRFLEHSRVYYFENACRPEVFVASADWMPRNFFRRIEVAFPIEDGVLRDRIISEVLAISLRDTTKAFLLLGDGSYHRDRSGKAGLRSQSEFIARALAEGKPQKRSSRRSQFPHVKISPRPGGEAPRKPGKATSE